MSRYVPWVVGLVWLTALLLAAALAIGVAYNYITEAL